jgi:tRNA-guanine transglycosylase
MQYQWRLGSDIHIAFDECTPYPITHAGAQKSMEQTHRWALRSLEEHKRVSHSGKRSASRIVKRSWTSQEDEVNHQALYGVVQGSVFPDLRKKSADFIAAENFDGIAIGGVAVGESKDEMRNVCDWVIPRLPQNKPRHLLGVGEIDDIFDIIERGVDTFDCVQPTRLARMGQVFTSSKFKVQSSKWTIDINNKKYAQDFSPISAECVCCTCANFTIAYLHHLFRVKELLGYRLLTLHNVHFVLSLVEKIRKSIGEGSYTKFKKRFLKI